MTDLASPELVAWESFYVIVGSSGAALIAIQFVVMTLLNDRRSAASADSISAFGTPTVVHLGGALVTSAILSAPWPSAVGPSIALASIGLLGVSYDLVTTRRARHQTAYHPVWQDWLWYMVLPGLAYASLAAGGFYLRADMSHALFVIAGAALSLLLIGIHNAWDSVTHFVVEIPVDERSARGPREDSESANAGARASGGGAPRAVREEKPHQKSGKRQ